MTKSLGITQQAALTAMAQHTKSKYVVLKTSWTKKSKNKPGYKGAWDSVGSLSNLQISTTQEDQRAEYKFGSDLSKS